MSESLLAGLTGFFRSWRGAPLAERPQLMRRMARRTHALEAALDGPALSTCLYCHDTTACKNAFETGETAIVEKFCPNAQHFRTAHTPDR